MLTHERARGELNINEEKMEIIEQQQDENEQLQQRRSKLEKLREKGNPYPNDFKRDTTSACLHAEHGEKSVEELTASKKTAKVAGRLMTRRIMGKASFINLQDMSGTIQIYVKRDELPEGVYEEFKHWDIGDFLGIEGFLFKTKTGELTIEATSIRLLTKSLRPLPDKWHGLSDQEIRYRQRYLDLICNQESRSTFHARSKAISEIRQFLVDNMYMEVETPMMQVIPGGAAARPFVTHHNALGMDLYLRVSPELYLKRLVVGGFERVFEINRNFRNEGLSTRHNPEFTMLEFYTAYSDFNDAMDITEELLRKVTSQVTGGMEITYGEKTFDLGKRFQRLSVEDAILQFNSEFDKTKLRDMRYLCDYAEKLKIKVEKTWGAGKVQVEIFEATAEEFLDGPVFITSHPTEVSPLARKNDADSFITDRFELYIGGREIANGFSELNDPEDQAQRFHDQVKEKDAGDLEAMHFDKDYIAALEHGLPPTAGVGIGIDRFVMLLTDSPSIRDVLLFPHMRFVE